jgi:O-antigen/teichoic acid export membrane protein
MTGRLKGNTLILLVNNVSSAGLAFLISVVIGRSLGAEGLGQYAFIMAWLGPLISFADFGMGSLVTRDVAQHADTALTTLHSATRALLPIAAGTLIVAWVAIPLLHAEPVISAALALTALLIVLDPWFGLYTAMFRAFQQMWPILLVNVGGLALQLLFTVAAIRSGAGLFGIAIGIIAVNAVQLFITWRLWRAYCPDLPRSAPIPIRKVLRQAWPFAVAAVLGALQLRLNVLLLEQLAGNAAVGHYSAANRFVEAGRMVPNALFGALFPALASLVAQPEAMRRTFWKASGLLIAFGIVFALAMTLLGGVLVWLTYDPSRQNFADAVPVLAVLSWALIPSLLRGLLTLYLYSLHRERFVNGITVIALAMQAVIGWLLIRQYGTIGAAISVGIIEGGMALCLGVRAFVIA